jgi:ABC-2 type transport system ATP-binding protein
MRILGWFLKKNKPLTTESIGFSYSNQEVLRDISMNLRAGEIVAIIGPSGCGKSTFLKIISGIISTSHTGKVRIFGRNKVFGKKNIGFVPQEISVIPDLSIEDNIKICGLNLGISEKKSMLKATKLLQLLKLSEDIKKTPNQLSGGQKVRLNIILSLLHDPEIIILDEPFAGLDFKNRRLLWHFLESMKRSGKSIILTSHLLTETQEHVDRIVILKKGKVFFTGQIEKLKEKMKMNFIYELRFTYLSAENLEKIRKFCDYKGLEIIDSFDRYLMFGINSVKEKEMINKVFEKLNLKYQEIGFREPNLDEIFLKA